MEWDFIAPMITAIVLTVTIGGVLVLRPLSHRLAELLEAMARNRQAPMVEDELIRVREAMETLASRMELLEERLDFTERLISDQSTASRREREDAGEG